MPQILTKTIGAVLELIYLKQCVVCGASGRDVCHNCLLELTLVRAKSCPSCRRLNTSGRIDKHCRRKNAIDGVTAAVRPEFVIEKMLRAFKYRNLSALAVELGTILSHAVKKEALKFDCVVPVPASGARLRVRGYNQAGLLAREIALDSNKPVTQLLRKVKHTPQQVGLTRAKRLSNLSGAFAAVSPRKISGRNILLVDDVTTTLATLNECAMVLKAAGAKKVWAAVLYQN